jgi:hypothetical protein
MATFHYSLCPEEKAMTRSVLIVLHETRYLADDPCRRCVSAMAYA